jgi:hypothetical protein
MANKVIRLTESELIGMIKNLIREFREKYPMGNAITKMDIYFVTLK